MTEPRRQSRDSPGGPTTSTNALDIRVEFARRAAVAAAKAAQETIALGLLREIDNDEFEQGNNRRFVVSQDANHPGSPPVTLDFDARDAALTVLRSELRDLLKIDSSDLIECGEESPDRNVRLWENAYLLRLDALDGTKNSLAFWTGYSSVICIDQARPNSDGFGGRAKHLAGAIATPSGVISWTNNSRFDMGLNRYPQVRGNVYIEHPLYMPERPVFSRVWKREADVIAAVAHSEARYRDALQVMESIGFGHPERFYTAGGTPLAPALVGGSVGAIVEPRPVSLHDSCLLIPHQLLGGVITDTKNAPFDYLAIYESNGLELDPNHKPIPGYIAWGGLSKER